jgi:uncharacterized protein
VIYLDSSAIIKLIRPEAQSAQLHAWLTAHSDRTLVSSVLAEIEVLRALRRADPARLASVPTILAKINRVEIDVVVRATAAAYGEPQVRSLDAIHLASAQSLVLEGLSLSAFVTYDKRLLATARDVGFSVANPGA